MPSRAGRGGLPEPTHGICLLLFKKSIGRSLDLHKLARVSGASEAPESRSASIPPRWPPCPAWRSRRRWRWPASLCIMIPDPNRAPKPSNGRSRDRSLKSPSRGWSVLVGCGEVPEREDALPPLEIQALDRGGSPRIGPEARHIRPPCRWIGPSANRGRRRVSAQDIWSLGRGFCLNAPVHWRRGPGDRSSGDVRDRSVRVRGSLSGGCRARARGAATQGRPYSSPRFRPPTAAPASAPAVPGAAGTPSGAPGAVSSPRPPPARAGDRGRRAGRGRRSRPRCRDRRRAPR